MKHFLFRLEAVLRFRQQKCEDAMADYAKAMQRRLSMEEKYREQVDQVMRLNNQVNQIRSGVFSPGMQPSLLWALEESSNELVVCQENTNKAAMEEKNKFEQFLEAKKGVDILLRLREKKENHHRLEEFRREQKEIEEIVCSRREALV